MIIHAGEDALTGFTRSLFSFSTKVWWSCERERTKDTWKVFRSARDDRFTHVMLLSRRHAYDASKGRIDSYEINRGRGVTYPHIRGPYKISLYKRAQNVSSHGNWCLYQWLLRVSRKTHICMRRFWNRFLSSSIYFVFKMSFASCESRIGGFVRFRSRDLLRILDPRKSNIRLYSQRIVNCPRKFTIVSTSSIKPGARIVRSPIETWLEEPRCSSYVPCSKLAALNVIAR